jgi:hypothetical protein
VVDGLAAVSLSKMMHMFNPQLFMMCDSTILEQYGYSNNTQGYINFLQKIKSIIIKNNLVQEYDDSEVKKDVSLLKLIDEYNMQHRDKEYLYSF